MKNNRAALRYAKAALSISLDQGTAPAFEQDMVEVIDVCNANEDLVVFLDNPVLSIETKKETINFSGGWNCLTDGLGLGYQTVSAKLEAVSDTVYKATSWAPVGSSFSFESVVLTKNTDRRNKRDYGDFKGKVRGKYGWNISVDLEKGIMWGSGWNRDSLLALSVKIITLDALECTFYLRRIDK